ncbi:hypothetical protein [Fictibacillus barbaricus]|uniref:Lipoprotein n=1 Tax=Fictibacillus barbaricus TaxID=182136 RepID=A0ABU1U238_9BACL|nr:hypothetical protein [Fictibacillus barbaricus]MDR7073556.1 hypothetical protein [Fictibacillus barbaricus]
MKIRIGFTIVAIVFLLVGCLEKKDIDLNQHPLSAEKEGTFSLFVLDKKLDTVSSDSLRKQGILNVSKINAATSLKSAQKRYGFLKLKKLPTYVVFDTKQVLYKSSDYKQLLDYLKKHQ